MRARFFFIIIINVMCGVNIRGHEANFYEAEARCQEAEIEAEARKSEAEAERFGLEATWASRPQHPCHQAQIKKIKRTDTVK